MKEKIVYIAVDPGKSGFISMFNGTDFEFYAMPECSVETGKILKSGKAQTKKIFDEKGLRELVFKIHRKYIGWKFVAAIEKVHGIGGSSATNIFTFGYITGLQTMILIMLNAHIIKVKPQVWQSFVYRGFDKIMKKSSTGKTMVHDTKASSIAFANKVAKDIDFRKTSRAKKSDDNKTDSFLILRWLIKNYKK